MAARKKTVRGTTRTAVRNTRGRVARTWGDARDVLGAGQATVEKQVRGWMRRTGLDAEKASRRLTSVRHQLELQRRKAMKQIEGRLLVIQARAKKERRAMMRRMDDAVRAALAALNLPSRQEVHELTRRVEDLSKKIDGFRRTTPRRSAATAPAGTVATA